MQVLKDAPGLFWTIKAHAAKKERILSKGEDINCCTRWNLHHVQPKNFQRRGTS